MSARSIIVLSAAVAALIVPSFSAARQPASEGATLTLAAPAARAEYVIDGAAWSCTGADCKSNFVDDMPALRSCKRVVSETGAVTAFTWRGKILSDAEIAVCNTRAKA
ncbi:hypothetical protein ABI_27350 [Asticcacaulis biprosthecium C19]|uniref:Uncharacterized protein n=1 Tax=Asticcacaulis biprosthecium C19 TaxID=715226 RepID=F4QM79_9CAUL|nr:hypothetical protein [Asticcacaulis biprosthecium]EGF91320.1 hypothetical protein ABI_27350 [Asticcacaulis biprosthecium C19]